MSDPRAEALQESRTYENLREAFASDAQAAARYAFFAHRSDEAGQLDIEELFSALARGKSAHAEGALRFLRDAVDPQTREPIRTPRDHLRSAIARCAYEHETLYPRFAKTAREEGFDEVADWFETLAKAEKSHAGRFQSLLDNM